MTLYLALDTATSLGSVALGDEHELLGELVIGDRRHAAATVAGIEQLLKIANRKWSDLGGVIVADGPGSFTGLRIGFATMKGLVAAHPELKVRRAPSLMSAAFGAAAFVPGAVAAVYDALRGEVFAAVYQFEPQRLKTLLSPCLTTPAALLELPFKPQLAVGDAALLHAEGLRRWTGRDPVAPPAGGPRASALLGLLGIPDATEVVSEPGRVEPNYGRLAEAQRRWEAKHGRPLPDPGSY